MRQSTLPRCERPVPSISKSTPDLCNSVRFKRASVGSRLAGNPAVFGRARSVSSVEKSCPEPFEAFLPELRANAGVAHDEAMFWLAMAVVGGEGLYIHHVPGGTLAEFD